MHTRLPASAQTAAIPAPIVEHQVVVRPAVELRMQKAVEEGEDTKLTASIYIYGTGELLDGQQVFDESLGTKVDHGSFATSDANAYGTIDVLDSMEGTSNLENMSCNRKSWEEMLAFLDRCENSLRWCVGTHGVSGLLVGFSPVKPMVDRSPFAASEES